MPSIDINSNTPRQQWVATASQTVFNTNFIAFDDDDVVVVVDGTVQASGYTITNLEDEDGFTVTFDSGLTGGEVVTVYRDSTIQRASQYQQDGRFDAAPLERDLDIIITILQEQERDLQRAALIDIDSTVQTVTLPNPQDGYALVWDGADGDVRNSTTSLANIESYGATITTNIDAIISVAGDLDGDDNVGTVADSISNVDTLAANISGVNSFAERYRVGATDPVDDLDEGDLFYNTTSDILKYYSGSAWLAVEASTVTLSGDNTWTGTNVFQDVVDVTNVNAEGSSGGNLRTNGGTNCLSWGGGGAANLTLGGNMSGGSSHKLVNMADGTAAQDYVTKSQLDASGLIGEVKYFAGTSVPSGYLLCDGAAVSRTTYADLFAAIGTTHGSGDGSTTFNLPDEVTNNRFRRAADGSTINVGDTQTSQNLAHTHTVYADNIDFSEFSPNGGTKVLNSSGDSNKTTSSSGGSEARPHNIAYLPIIRF